jgi:hypothetical protein
MQHGRDFAVIGCVAAFMVANTLLVDPNVRAIVRGADVEKGPRVRFGLGVEVALIPKYALIVEELWDDLSLISPLEV